MPSFSVVIPTYNRSELVVQAVESVLAQTVRELEVIVVDNGSMDDTAAALTRFGDAIRVVRQGNEGRAGGRNRGIAEATGTWIAFLDSDDLWLPDKLERQAAALEGRPDAGLVHGHVRVIDDAGAPLPALTESHRRLFEAAHARPVTYADYALECRCLTSTVVIPASVLAAVGPYDPTVGQEDLDLYLRIARRAPIVFLGGAPLASYRYHADQTGLEALTRGQIAVSEKHLALLDAEPETPETRLARRNFLVALSGSYHVLLELGAARRYALAAIRLDPGLLRSRRLLRRLLVSFLPAGIVRRLRRRRTPEIA